MPGGIFMARLAILALLIALAGFRLILLDYAELYSWDEAIYGCWGRAIAEHGVWFDQTDYPVWDYQSRRYPPLFLWAMAASFRAFGVSEASARLVPALSGVLLVVAAYWMGTRHGYRSTGLWMALFVGLNYVLTHFSRFAMTESTYLLLLFLAFAAYQRSLSDKRKRWIVLSGFAFGLSVMTKGVVALLFPLGGFLFSLLLLQRIPWTASTRRALPRSGIAFTNLAIASALGLLLAAPWHLYMVVRQGTPFIHDYFLWNVWERVTVGVDLQQKALGPLYYINQLPIRIPFGFALFLLSLFQLARWLQIGRAIQEERPPEDEQGRRKELQSSSDEHQAVTSLLFFSWFAVALAAFSIAQSKLVQYTPPIILPALVLAALQADRIWRDGFWRRADYFVLTIPLILFWAALTPWRLAVRRTIVAAIGSSPPPRSRSIPSSMLRCWAADLVPHRDRTTIKCRPTLLARPPLLSCSPC